MKASRRTGKGRHPTKKPSDGIARTSSKNCRALRGTRAKGEVHFILKRIPGGLYVEREDIPKRGLRTMQSAQFTDLTELERWLEQDPVRFELPLLHISLRRDAEELWSVAEPLSDEED